MVKLLTRIAENQMTWVGLGITVLFGVIIGHWFALIPSVSMYQIIGTGILYLFSISLIILAAFSAKWARVLATSNRSTHKLSKQMLNAIELTRESLYRLNTRFESIETQLDLVGRDSCTINRGVLGLHQAALQIDNRAVATITHYRSKVLRYSLQGHINTYMRREMLTEEKAIELHSLLVPTHLKVEYARTQMKRQNAFKQLLKGNSEVRELYSKVALTHYAISGRANPRHNIKAKDDFDERIVRLQSLVHYLTKYSDTYEIKFLRVADSIYDSAVGEQIPYHQGPHYLVTKDQGLVVDLQTTDYNFDSEKTIDGFRSDNPVVAEQFIDKFLQEWKLASDEDPKQVLNILVEKVKKLKSDAVPVSLVDEKAKSEHNSGLDESQPAS